MVRMWIVFLVFMFTNLHSEVIVEASIDNDEAYENFPIHGTITITHAKDQLIDSSTFELEQKPLDASFVKKVAMFSNANELVSIYSFEMPGKEKGLYILPSISVKVGNQFAHSAPSSYEIKGQSLGSKILTTPQEETIFKLEAKVEGSTILYPGERSKFQYLIFYNRNVDLTHSFFPLIHPEHFRKVGDVQIKEYEVGNVSIQQLTQEVEASNIGTFVYGPSKIEGYEYSIENGKKEYSSTLLTSEAPAITIEVKPFPDNIQPPFFSGFLGTISAQAELKSNPSVSIGDHIQMQVHVEGIKNEQEVRFPLLNCQPGFDGFFQIGDLPPISRQKGNVYTFSIDLRPLTSLIDAIPSIALSSFEPESHKYVIVKTDQIPIEIRPSPMQSIRTMNPFLFPFPQTVKWGNPKVTALEKLSTSSTSSIHTHSFKKKSFVYWLFAVLGLLWIQWIAHRLWKNRPRVIVPKSKELYGLALKNFKSPQSLHLHEEAVWNLLREKNYIIKEGYSFKKNKEDEKSEMAQKFIYELQSLQYSQEKKYDVKKLREEAKRIFELLN